MRANNLLRNVCAYTKHFAKNLIETNVNMSNEHTFFLMVIEM